MANKEKLALDLGGPILKARGGSSPAGYRAALPTPGGFEGVRRLYHERFHENLVLLSQCTEEIELVKRDWFRRHDFFAKTGVPRECVVFVREPHEKAAVCEREKVTHFVDDRPHILRHAIGIVPNLFLFGADPIEAGAHPDVLLAAHAVDGWERLLVLLLP